MALIVAKDGKVHATCHVGKKGSKDGQDHPLNVVFDVLPQPKGWPDSEYQHYLYDKFLKESAKVKTASGFQKGPAPLSDEEKAARKKVSAARSADKRAKLDILDAAGVSSAGELRQKLQDAGMLD